ncbi:alpha-2Da adrenergic receptor-like [Penaeus monodon]|uniref:alpha-2Da adrenergic receptor-like n=1 Tax=Penaeus monodon TaxID=6687 RepID=UPI0018A77176|nr:alpha-2Da adrenergic receptor-like [Penaeus monodon]
MAVYDLNLTSSLDGLLLSTSGPESGQDGGVSWGGESLSEAFNSTGEFGNMSTPFTQGPGVKRYVYPIMLPVIIAFCVASGLVSCAVVSATPWVRRPMSPTVRLSLSLAAANTVFAASVSVALVVNSYLPSVHNISTGMCVGLTLEAVRMGSILVQILHLLVVALNHYIGTLRPLHYAATMTPSILKVILVALWIIPMVGMVVGFASIPGQGYQSEGCQNNHFYISGITFRIVWTALFFGPTLLIIIVYCHIFHLLKHRGPHLVSAEQRNQLRRNIKVKMKAEETRWDEAAGIDCK